MKFAAVKSTVKMGNRLLLGVLIAQGMCGGTVQALTINLNDVGGTSGTGAGMAYRQAADIWESLLLDDVTVNLDVGFTSMNPFQLGRTDSNGAGFSYEATRTALAGDATSTADTTAVNNLQSGPAFDTYINRTLDNPNGAFSATPYLDDDNGLNNQLVAISTANARALGLFAATDGTTDALIRLNSDFDWDFDNSDGLDLNHFDFVSVALHEIGHVLGFASAVDRLDRQSPLLGGPGADDDYFSATLDLFRYSELSAGVGVSDMSADDRDKYFSIDGGATNLAWFAEGENFGEGYEASHWRVGLGLGVMGATFGVNAITDISQLDLLALDVIGWDLATSPPIPEPATLVVLGMGLVGLVCRRRGKSD